MIFSWSKFLITRQLNGPDHENPEYVCYSFDCLPSQVCTIEVKFKCSQIIYVDFGIFKWANVLKKSLGT
jgi:hypothetical protein